MKRSKKEQKGPFDKLSEDWRAQMESAKDYEIDAEIQKAAMNNDALAEAKALDIDLKQCQEAVKTASAIYSEGTKANNLKVKFLRRLKLSRGGSAPEAADFAKKDPA